MQLPHPATPTPTHLHKARYAVVVPRTTAHEATRGIVSELFRRESKGKNQ